MLVYLKAGGGLRDHLKPDVDAYTRRIEAPEGSSVHEILGILGIHPGLVAFITVEGKATGLGFVPRDGQVVTLHPPVTGG